MSCCTIISMTIIINHLGHIGAWNVERFQPSLPVAPLSDVCSFLGWIFFGRSAYYEAIRCLTQYQWVQWVFPQLHACHWRMHFHIYKRAYLRLPLLPWSANNHFIFSVGGLPAPHWTMAASMADIWSLLIWALWSWTTWVQICIYIPQANCHECVGSKYVQGKGAQIGL